MEGVFRQKGRSWANSASATKKPYWTAKKIVFVVLIIYSLAVCIAMLAFATEFMVHTHGLIRWLHSR